MRILSKKSTFRLLSAAALSLLLFGVFDALRDLDVPVNAYRNSLQDIHYQLGWTNYREDTNPTPGMIVKTDSLLKYLESGNTYFSWDQWMDLSRVDLFDQRTLDSQLYPLLQDFEPNIWPRMPLKRKSTPQEQIMVASIYCKYFLSIPSSVIALRDPDSMCENTDESKHCEPNLLKNPNSPRVLPLQQYEVTTHIDRLKHRQFGHAEPKQYHAAFEPLCPHLKKPAKELASVDLVLPSVNETLFRWDAYSVANALLPDGTSWKDDVGLNKEAIIAHAYTVKYAVKDEKSQLKYFHETRLLNDTLRYGLHHDWRFFRGVLTTDEHIAALHHIARAWQQFTEQAGIVNWYSHGSLLGYYWNGMAMPFDDDHDVQIPVQELDRLARDFNRTLILQNPAEGNRKYLLDITPAYVVRERGNSKNLIDGRFIDIDTGVYIDITGLAFNKDSDIVISCRNSHSYDFRAFSRLRRTQFEGYPAMIPVLHQGLLGAEYGKYDNPKFGMWEFNKFTRHWEINVPCERYLKQSKSSQYLYCRPSEIENSPGCKELYGTCDRYAIERYKMSREYLNLFEKDTVLFYQIKQFFDRYGMSVINPDLPTLIDIVGTYIRPFKSSQIFAVKSLSEKLTNE